MGLYQIQRQRGLVSVRLDSSLSHKSVSPVGFDPSHPSDTEGSLLMWMALERASEGREPDQSLQCPPVLLRLLFRHHDEQQSQHRVTTPLLPQFLAPGRRNGKTPVPRVPGWVSPGPLTRGNYPRFPGHDPDGPPPARRSLPNYNVPYPDVGPLRGDRLGRGPTRRGRGS